VRPSMKSTDINSSRISEVESAFRDAGVELLNIDVRDYPEETIVVVEVPEEEIESGAAVGNALDKQFSELGFDGFVTVRRGQRENSRTETPIKDGVHDPRATQLARLIAERSRTSEAQPSLHYVKDVAVNISAATAPRHHLIFGRRGAGKTALMVEARRIVTGQGAVSLWLNLQTLRDESVARIFLRYVDRVCDLITIHYRQQDDYPQVALNAAQLQEEVKELLKLDEISIERAKRLVPEAQELTHRFLRTAAVRLFIFLDDFYYLRRDDQPLLLDMIHGSIRDTDAWLKVASIRHLTRWFQSDPPLGLQTGHDAELLDLDVTLQDPFRAKEFLESVLLRYARDVNVRRLSQLFARGSLDRLVLASGAVPRDYLTLAASALTRAKTRPRARLVGTQDINQAAGDAAQAKIQELEEDLAANKASATSTLSALSALKKFCLEQERSTFFRVDVRAKESQVDEYASLTSLLEVRLTHLVDPSVSDSKKAGERAEVFMLDLSQFAGARLRQSIRVLDLERGVVVSKRTGQRESTREGRTPRQLVTIYRSAPLLDLAIFRSPDAQESMDL
jgi:AAA ATPase domain